MKLEIVVKTVGYLSYLGEIIVMKLEIPYST